MAKISREEILRALTRLGELAQERNEPAKIVLTGGALMLLAFSARPSTRDVDAAILEPQEAARPRELARIVGEEQNLPNDWFNDGVKGFMTQTSDGPIIFHDYSLCSELAWPA